MSAPHDLRLVERALDELGLGAEWVADGADALRELCRRPRGYAAVIVGDRVGSISGWTLSGLARDAGVACELILVTGEETRISALRGATLGLAVLWRPASPRRLARALDAVLPRRLCVLGPTTPVGAGSRGVPPGP